MPPPLVLTEAADMRKFTRDQRREGKTIGFVPTMGYLHDGHISLVLAAREKCDVVVASIYVNPTQFSKNEDFGVYPRSQEEDLAKLEAAGCTAVFLPTTLYHHPPANPADNAMVVGATDAIDFDAHCTWVQVDRLSQGLCAGSRPHFFRGVCTVVTKLFNIVDPDAAFFGKKDYQQWRVLQRMARDLDFGVEIVGMPIQREADGLAMSSRNALLAASDRIVCPCIYKALKAAKEDVLLARVSSATALKRQIRDDLINGGGRIDYVAIVHAETLQPVEEVCKEHQQGQPILIAIAAHYGKVRLIDNIDF